MTGLSFRELAFWHIVSRFAVTGWGCAYVWWEQPWVMVGFLWSLATQVETSLLIEIRHRRDPPREGETRS